MSATTRKILENPIIESQLSCKDHQCSNFTVRISGNLVKVAWDDTISDAINPAMEDLWVEVRRNWDQQTVIAKKCTFQKSTEFFLDEIGSFQIRIVRKEHFKLIVATDCHYTPKVSVVSENEARHHITWSDIDWERIRNEVERATGLDWENQVELCLHVLRYPDPGGNLPTEELIEMGMTDYRFIPGLLKRVNLAIVEKDSLKGDTPKIAKIIFTVSFASPETLSLLGECDIEIAAKAPYFELKREIWEEDSVQLRAWWRLPESIWDVVKKEAEKAGMTWEKTSILIRLYHTDEHGRFVPEGQGGKLLPETYDWLFTGLKDGPAYRAGLFIVQEGIDLELPLMISNICPVPNKPDQIVLIPIDERRGYCYWHLDEIRLQRRLSKLHRESGTEVKTYIKVMHEWAGNLYHEMDKDAEVYLPGVDNYYLNLDPDRIYRVQLVAVAGNDITNLTDVSNKIQTARISPGNNPIEYKEVPPLRNHPTERELRSVMDTANHSIGLLIIHLHAHLPYIRQRVSYGDTGFWQPMGYPPEWYHEAVNNTYAPLIRMFEKLHEEGVDFRLSMDLSPTLSNMMRDEMLQEEFLKYIDSHINLAKAEVDRTKREAPHYNNTAWMHLNRFLEVKDCFLRYGCDLNRAFKKFQDLGYLEISTCGATHAFLPFHTAFPESIRAQVETAVGDYTEVFGREPNGIWLPECAYMPGIEKFVDGAGLRYFFAETHAVTLADAPAEFGTHAPVFIKGSDVAVFARDPETGKQVWSGEEGYPGDPDYLDFHFKGGPLRYNRITTRTHNWKEPYVREWAMEKAARHAQHFMESRNFRFQHIRNWFWKKPLIVAMYDAELFGHHWYEGTDFLYFLLKKLYYNQNETELTTPSTYLNRYRKNQDLFINTSSWGDKGTFDKWMYGSVSWMHRHTHEAAREIVAMATDLAQNQPENQIAKRIVAQAGRELLQAMNSDIPFVISNGHFVDRMKELFLEDLQRFWILQGLYWGKNYENPAVQCRLNNLEMTNPIFPEIDPFQFRFGI